MFPGALTFGLRRDARIWEEVARATDGSCHMASTQPLTQVLGDVTPRLHPATSPRNFTLGMDTSPEFEPG